MRLHRYQAAHQFLERCVESNNEFHEVRDLIMRNDTLVANHQVCSSSSDPRPALRFPIVCVVFTVYHPLGNSLGAHRVRYSEPAADQRPEAGAQEVRRGVFAYCFESLRGTYDTIEPNQRERSRSHLSFSRQDKTNEKLSYTNQLASLQTQLDRCEEHVSRLEGQLSLIRSGATSKLVLLGQSRMCAARTALIYIF